MAALVSAGTSFQPNLTTVGTEKKLRKVGKQREKSKNALSHVLFIVTGTIHQQSLVDCSVDKPTTRWRYLSNRLEPPFVGFHSIMT